MAPARRKRLPVRAARDLLAHDREHERARADRLEVPARHLQHEAHRARHRAHDARAALDAPRLELGRRRGGGVGVGGSGGGKCGGEGGEGGEVRDVSGCGIDEESGGQREGVGIGGEEECCMAVCRV